MKTLANDSLRNIVGKHCFLLRLINVSLSVSGNILVVEILCFFINVSLFVHLDKHCCGNVMLIHVCPPQETLFSEQNLLPSKWKY